MSIRGFKVVNYDKWESMPDLFNSSTEAIEKSKGWKFRKGAVVEKISSFYNTSLVVKYLK